MNYILGKGQKFDKRLLNATIGIDDELDLPETEVKEYKPLDFVTREQWGAAPSGPCEVLLNPVEYIIVSYTGTDPCHDDESCGQAVRNMQKEHMEKGLPDIMWNFMVAGNAKVYEGRGWHKNASKAKEHMDMDYKSVDIMYIGRYKKDLNIEQKKQLNEIIYHGIKNKFIEDADPSEPYIDVEYIEYEDYHNRTVCYDPFA